MNRVSSSVHRVLHALRHNRHALPHALRQRLVTALIFPYLDYAAPLILDLDALNSAKLYRLLNSAVRFVFGNIPYNAHVTPYRLALGWLSSRRRCEYIAILLALKIISTWEPRGLAGLFTVRERRPDEIATRSRAVRLVVSSTNTATLRKGFVASVSRLINSLPFIEDPRCPPPLALLKAQIHNHLYLLDVQDWRHRCEVEGLTYEPRCLSDRLPPRSSHGR
uniref:Uncharacterized protein n=1 Tax=Trichogramma kaykai TaxID=54128 RepID=A0ABD2WVG3_9HYME